MRVRPLTPADGIEIAAWRYPGRDGTYDILDPPTSDEGYWLQRTVRFGEAVLTRDWVQTARSGHPGVTVMWSA